MIRTLELLRFLHRDQIRWFLDHTNFVPFPARIAADRAERRLAIRQRHFGKTKAVAAKTHLAAQLPASFRQTENVLLLRCEHGKPQACSSLFTDARQLGKLLDQTCKRSRIS